MWKQLKAAISLIPLFLLTACDPNEQHASTGGKLETDLCDSQDARDLLKQVIEDKTDSLKITKLIDLGTPKELYLDEAKNVRYCQAPAVLNTGETEISFKLFYGPSGNGNEIIEIQEGADAFDTAAMKAADAAQKTAEQAARSSAPANSQETNESLQQGDQTGQDQQSGDTSTTQNSADGSTNPSSTTTKTSKEIVEEFYNDISSGKAEEASQLVDPSKRTMEAYSTEGIDKFYRSLGAPLALEEVSPDGTEKFQVRYSYIYNSGYRCHALAEVNTTTDANGQS